MAELRQKSIGAIWEKKDSLFMKLDCGMTFTLKKTEKKTEKFPDYKEGIAAVWRRISRKGTEYLTVQVGDDRYLGFKNRGKTEEKHPDWALFIPKER